MLIFDDIALPNVWRVAQKVQTLINDRSVTFFNTHLHHKPLSDESIRYPQAQALLDWMHTRETPKVLMGDMNATPDSITINLFKDNLISTYAAVHGQEPDRTFPTPLTTHGKDNDGLTIDYIFLSKSDFSIENCTLIGNQQLTEDPVLYPSDHFGVCAEFNLRSRDSQSQSAT